MHIYTLNTAETLGSSLCCLDIIKVLVRQENLNSFINWTFQIGAATLPPPIENTPLSTCIYINKKHIDASVKERPQTLFVPSEEIYMRVLCNKHI